MNADMMQAWRQDRLDLAKMWFQKIPLEALDPTYTEILADLTFEIGKAYSKQGANGIALQWLERAYDLLATKDVADFSPDVSDLKMSLSHRIIRTQLAIGGDGGWEKARSLLSDLRLEHGDRLLVLLLELELMSTEPIFPAQDYFIVLQKIARSVHTTDSNLRTIFHHLHKLKSNHPDLAFLILKTLTIERLLGAASTSWIEKAVLTAVWLSTSSPEMHDTIADLEELLETVYACTSAALGPHATHAAQMVETSAENGGPDLY